jgi:hypothetical protein
MIMMIIGDSSLIYGTSIVALFRFGVLIMLPGPKNNSLTITTWQDRCVACQYSIPKSYVIAR